MQTKKTTYIEQKQKEEDSLKKFQGLKLAKQKNKQRQLVEKVLFQQQRNHLRKQKLFSSENDKQRNIKYS